MNDERKGFLTQDIFIRAEVLNKLGWESVILQTERKQKQERKQNKLCLSET